MTGGEETKIWWLQYISHACSGWACGGAAPSGRGGAIGFACQAAYLWNMRPTPSMTPRRQAQVMALFLVCFQPPLMASAPPVKKPTDDGVPWVLALSDGLDGAVEGGEETTPHTEVTAEDGGTGLDGAERTDAALAHGRVAEALDSVPYDTTDRAHGERAAEIVQNNDGTGVSRVVSGHGRVCAVCSCVGGVCEQYKKLIRRGQSPVLATQLVLTVDPRQRTPPDGAGRCCPPRWE